MKRYSEWKGGTEMETSEVLLGHNETLMNQTIQCELCGEQIPYMGIRKTDKYVYLCVSCSKYLETLPEAINGSINEFLIGNVI